MKNTTIIVNLVLMTSFVTSFSCHKSTINSYGLANLTKVQLDSYIAAIGKLSSGSYPTIWDSINNKLISHYKDTKKVIDQITWQHFILDEMSSKLRAAGSLIDVPYWDFTLNSNIKTDVVLSGKILGTTLHDAGCPTLDRIPHIQPEFLGDIPVRNCLIRIFRTEEFHLLTKKEIGYHMVYDKESFTKFINQINPRVYMVEDRLWLIPLQPEDPLLYSYLAYIDVIIRNWCLMRGEIPSKARRLRAAGIDSKFFRGIKV